VENQQSELLDDLRASSLCLLVPFILLFRRRIQLSALIYDILVVFPARDWLTSGPGHSYGKI
jgi:hypothetical protein